MDSIIVIIILMIMIFHMCEPSGRVQYYQFWQLFSKRRSTGKCKSRNDSSDVILRMNKFGDEETV